MAANLSSADLAALAKIGITVTTFGPVDETHTARCRSFLDYQGTYAKWFAHIGARAVLVRPDFYVSGSATTMMGVAELVADFLARVSGRERALDGRGQ